MRAASFASVWSRSPRASFAASRPTLRSATASCTAAAGSCRSSEVTRAAYFARVPLSATGFYATPKIHYDRKTLSGRPFFYYAYGAAVSEVAIDTLTGEHRLVAVDILHDVGSSLNPAIDRGQIEGGFLQGWGWLAMEELWWNARGELRTHAPSTYKIPTSRDWPDAVSHRVLARAESRGHDLSQQGGRRAAVHAGAVRVPCDPRRDRERGATIGCRPGSTHRRPTSVSSPRSTSCRRAGSASSVIAHGRVARRRCAERSRRGERVVLVTVAAGIGSTPREAGAAMVVTTDAVVGNDRRRSSRVRGAAPRTRGACSAAPHRRNGWCVSRSPRAWASAAAASRRCAFATLDASALPWLDVACGLCARAHAVRGRRTHRAGCACGRAARRHGGRRARLARRRGARFGGRRARARSRSRPTRASRGDRLRSRSQAHTLLVHVVRPDADARSACSATVTSDARWCRCSARCRPTCAGSTRARTTSPRSVPANVEIVATDDPTAEVAARRRARCLVVMTHSHALDFDIVEAALARDDWTYVGLIGSKSKRAQFERRLLARGTPPDSLQRLTCPIGAGLAAQQGAGRHRGRGRRASCLRCARRRARRPAIPRTARARSRCAAAVRDARDAQAAAID